MKYLKWGVRGILMGFIVGATALLGLSKAPHLHSTLVFLSILVIVLFVVNYMVYSKRKKGLGEKCNAEEFVNVYQKKFEKHIKNGTGNQNLMLELNYDLARGFMAQGRFREAREIFQQWMVNMPKPMNNKEFITKMNIIFCCYSEGEKEQANKDFMDLKKELKHTYVGNKRESVFCTFRYLALEAFHNEEYEKALYIYKKMVKMKINRGYHSEALFGLGRVYEKLGDAELSKDKYEKCIKYGGDFYFTKIAKQKMNHKL